MTTQRSYCLVLMNGRTGRYEALHPFFDSEEAALEHFAKAPVYYDSFGVIPVVES